MTRTRHSDSRHTERGAILIMLILALPLLTGVVLYAYRMGVLMGERARMQELADVAALQAAAIQARGLNALAIMNDVLLGIEGLAAGVVLNGNGLALGLDAMLVTIPEGIELHKVSYETFVRLRDLSTQVAALQDLTATALVVAPVAGAQLPLLFEKFDPLPLLVAYPLPGLDVGLTSTPPVSTRGLAFDNLSTAITEEILGAADNLLEPFNQKLRSIAKNECAAVKKVKKLSRYVPWGKKFINARVKFKAVAHLDPDDVAAVCDALRELAKEDGGLIQARLENLLSTDALGFGPSSGGGIGKQKSIAGFSQPLLLDTGYGKNYQVAVLAARCAPYADCPSTNPADQIYAIAQARAASRRQPGGGDLYFPDFKATLVPVSIFSAISNLNSQTSNLPEGPWSILH